MNAIDYGFISPNDYTENNHTRMCRFIQIEHRDAITQLDEIMKNPYIDGYIFEPTTYLDPTACWETCSQIT